MLRTWPLLFLFSISAFGDYAYIARSGVLHMKLGADYSSTNENFINDSSRTSIVYQNQVVDLATNTFWLQPEYGFADGWATSLRFRAWMGNVNPVNGGGTAATGSGIGDLDLAIQHSVMEYPLGVVEFVVRLPTYQYNVPANVLVGGDGSVDFGLFYHVASVYDRLRFLVSPGIVGRTVGYPPLIKLFAGTEIRVEPAYLRIFLDSQLSIGEKAAYATSLTSNQIAGSGGSFSRLSGAPTGVDVGLKMGVELMPGYFLEAFFSHSVWGSRYANALAAGVNFHAVVDLHPADKGPKLREVPLDKPAEVPPL
ncbi:MAG: hypothetical protein HYZ71_08205 [Deltaproteobacteria bacterium]|nr:hypothetical protein [Deltaproteobacteria bacterium]